MNEKVSKWVLVVVVGIVTMGLMTNPVKAAETSINILNYDFVVPDPRWSTVTNWDTDPGGAAGWDWFTLSGTTSEMGYMNPESTLQQNLVYTDSSPVLIAPNQCYTVTTDFGRRLDHLVGNSPVEINLIDSNTNAVLYSRIYNLANNQALGTIATQTLKFYTGAATGSVGHQARLQYHLISPSSPSSDQAAIDNVHATVAPTLEVPINIQNSRFEADSLGNGGWTANVTGWDIADGDWGDGCGDPSIAEFAGQAGDVNNLGFLNPDGRLFQNLVYADMSPVLVAANQKYTVTADIGLRLDATNLLAPVEVNLIETGTNAVIASALYQAGGQGLGTITTQTFTLDTGASPIGLGTQARLEFHLVGWPTPDQVMLDNVLATVAVPEPATLAFLLAGGLVSLRRFRKN